MISEFELIRRYFTHRAQGAVLGVGDDAALVRVKPGCELAISTDMLVAGQHFFPDADPVRLGHKALAVNLSDMAAMGAVPRWVTLALALPQVDPRWLAGFARGFMALARRFKVDLVGGDTTRGPLNICVHILGEVPRGRALRRDGAKTGHDVWVSGTLGGAALAVAAGKGRIALNRSERKVCADRLDLPEPRVALGVALRRVASSAIDISDGLVADLGHIAEESGVGAVIGLDLLPRVAAMTRHAGSMIAREALLSGGDDYELCFTAPANRRAAVAAIGRRLGLVLTCIGSVVRAPGVTHRVMVLDRDGRPVDPDRAGFDHFK
jgi:thiamine-monophosphate kinase